MSGPKHTSTPATTTTEIPSVESTRRGLSISQVTPLALTVYIYPNIPSHISQNFLIPLTYLTLLSSLISHNISYLSSYLLSLLPTFSYFLIVRVLTQKLDGLHTRYLTYLISPSISYLPFHLLSLLLSLILPPFYHLS